VLWSVLHLSYSKCTRNDTAFYWNRTPLNLLAGSDPDNNLHSYSLKYIFSTIWVSKESIGKFHHILQPFLLWSLDKYRLEVITIVNAVLCFFRCMHQCIWICKEFLEFQSQKTYVLLFQLFVQRTGIFHKLWLVKLKIPTPFAKEESLVS